MEERHYFVMQSLVKEILMALPSLVAELKLIQDSEILNDWEDISDHINASHWNHRPDLEDQIDDLQEFFVNLGHPDWIVPFLVHLENVQWTPSDLGFLTVAFHQVGFTLDDDNLRQMLLHQNYLKLPSNSDVFDPRRVIQFIAGIVNYETDHHDVFPLGIWKDLSKNMFFEDPPWDAAMIVEILQGCEDEWQFLNQFDHHLDSDIGLIRALVPKRLSNDVKKLLRNAGYGGFIALIDRYC